MTPSLGHLGDSYSKAVQTLYRLEKKFNAQPQFEQLYKEFMWDYISQGHMSRVDPSSTSFWPLDQTYFLPHHGVLKPSSTTTKLRTVFNGSSKTSNGISINDMLLKGENLFPELPVLISNWRIYKYVFVADIRQMFRQIRIHEDDAHYQAVVWRFNVNDPVEVYYLNTITYGIVSSPWQAARTLRLLADENSEEFPLAHPVIYSECYMDDMLSGEHTIHGTREKQRQLIELLKAGGMQLRKWLSNHPCVIDHLPSEQLAAEPDVLFLNSSSFAILGLHWHAKEDCFSFNISSSELPAKLTKRVTLSLIAQIFDPMGWLAPVIVTAKIFMQTLWLLNCGWDDELPNETSDQWRGWYARLSALRTLRVPRHIDWSPEVTLCEVHGFSDA